MFTTFLEYIRKKTMITGTEALHKDDSNRDAFKSSAADIKMANYNNNYIPISRHPIQRDKLLIETKTNWLHASLPSIILVVLVMTSVVLGRRYIMSLLLYMDTLDFWQSALIFEFSYVVVSFPIMWGYVLLNIACGYSYGFLLGTLVTCVCSTSGMMLSHLVIRKCFKKQAEKKYTSNTQAKLLMSLVAGPNGWKILFLARLSPIPYGVQNTVFAVSKISTPVYICTSVIAQLITQLVYAYMGSTFRSITQVLSSSNSNMTWSILILQVGITLALMVFVMRLAKKELSKNMPDSERHLVTESRGIQTSEPTYNQELRFSRAPVHSRNLSVNIPPIIDRFSNIHTV